MHQHRGPSPSGHLPGRVGPAEQGGCCHLGAVFVWMVTSMHGANLVPEFQPHGVHLVELVRQRSLSLLAGALILAACVSCGDATDTRPVTREEAEHALADVVAIARSGNFDALCSYQGVNQAMCERQLEFAGVPAPSTAPAVAASRELRADPHPGLVLRLCGTKDSGEQYVSDLAVWRVDRTSITGILGIITPRHRGYGKASWSIIGSITVRLVVLQLARWLRLGVPRLTAALPPPIFIRTQVRCTAKHGIHI